MFVPILDVDRGRADFRYIKAVVMEVDDSDNYKLRMEHDVPSLTVSLREGGRNLSIGLGQRLFKCSCTTGCNSKCKQAEKICNGLCKNK